MMDGTPLNRPYSMIRIFLLTLDFLFYIENLIFLISDDLAEEHLPLMNPVKARSNGIVLIQNQMAREIASE